MSDLLRRLPQRQDVADNRLLVKQVARALAHRDMPHASHLIVVTAFDKSQSVSARLSRRSLAPTLAVCGNGGRRTVDHGHGDAPLRLEATTPQPTANCRCDDAMPAMTERNSTASLTTVAWLPALPIFSSIELIAHPEQHANEPWYVSLGLGEARPGVVTLMGADTVARASKATQASKASAALTLLVLLSPGPGARRAQRERSFAKVSFHA